MRVANMSLGQCEKMYREIRFGIEVHQDIQQGKYVYCITNSLPLEDMPISNMLSEGLLCIDRLIAEAERNNKNNNRQIKIPPIETLRSDRSYFEEHHYNLFDGIFEESQESWEYLGSYGVGNEDF